MSFQLDHFSRARPFLYHLTAATNLQRIRRTMRLESAKRIFEAAGEPALIRMRRRESRLVAIDGESVHVRDQAPLHAGNMTLDAGWTFEDFVAHLNERVFFWPGRESGPISYGQRHFARYESDGPAILQISTEDLIAANPDAIPQFCKYNSGSPRCSYGKKSPRTAQTFADASDLQYGATSVVEVTFKDFVVVPNTSRFGFSLTGPWQLLREIFVLSIPSKGET